MLIVACLFDVGTCSCTEWVERCHRQVLGAMTAKYRDELRDLSSAESFRKTNMARIENRLETKVDQKNVVAMAGLYNDALIVQYQYVVDLLGPVSAQAVQQVNKHLMYLKETSTTAQVIKYGITEVSLRWLTCL